MKIFLDSLDLEQIRRFRGIISGITCNATFRKQFGVTDEIQLIKDIRKILPDGEIHLDASGDTSNELLYQIDTISGHSDDNNLVFKIPFSEIAMEACRLTPMRINMHLIFSINQALLATQAGATYICPLVGRLDDIGHDALENVGEIKDAFEVNNEHTAIMVSSVRHPKHVADAYKLGVDAITIPPHVLEDMFNHPLTEIGENQFKKDLEQCTGSV